MVVEGRSSDFCEHLITPIYDVVKSFVGKFWNHV